MTSRTLRLLNKCRECQHSWYPRRSVRSVSCPECNSPHVRFALGLKEAVALLLVGAGMAAGAFALWGPPSGPNAPLKGDPGAVTSSTQGSR